MKKVNISDKEFSVELNKSSDNQMYKMLMDWKDEIEKGKTDEEDLWYQIPALPQFLFKKLKMVDNQITENSEGNNMTITFKYDDWQKNNT
jgi:hypothetical protein